MCVRDHSYACVYTWRLGTPTASQHNSFGLEQLSQICLVLLTGGLNLACRWESVPNFPLEKKPKGSVRIRGKNRLGKCADHKI